MKRTIVRAGIAATLLTLAGCSGPQSQAERERDDVPTKAVAQSQIEARLRARGYTVPFPKSEHRCTDVFDITQVEIIDSTVQMGVAVVKAAAVITAKENVEAGGWVGLNCFGGPFVKGQMANHVEDFTFQKWNSGWVLQ